jgi:ATP-dependent DNA ligase
MLEQIPFSDAALMTEFKNVEEKGLEGLMLRADMPYQGGKRSHYLTKYKTMQDAEFLCVAVNIGDFNTKQDGKEITLKNVMCSVTIIHPKGAQVNVGTGFTMEERKSFAQNPSLIKGKLLKIRYMEETSNQKNKEISLRFPVFLGIKTD